MTDPDTAHRQTGPQDMVNAFDVHYTKMDRGSESEHATEVAQRAETACVVTAVRLVPTLALPALKNLFIAQQLAAALGKMQNRKAPGGDGLSAELLKCNDEAKAFALLALMNSVWLTGCVPASWRKSEMVSVYKADDPLDCDNPGRSQCCYRSTTCLRRCWWLA